MFDKVVLVKASPAPDAAQVLQGLSQNELFVLGQTSSHAVVTIRDAFQNIVKQSAIFTPLRNSFTREVSSFSEDLALEDISKHYDKDVVKGIVKAVPVGGSVTFTSSSQCWKAIITETLTGLASTLASESKRLVLVSARESDASIVTGNQFAKSLKG